MFQTIKSKDHNQPFFVKGPSLKFNRLRMNEQLSVLYNGKPTEITCMPENVFYVQITTAPYLISYIKNEDGMLIWYEVEDKRQTWLSNTLVCLIQEHFANNQRQFK